MSSKSTTYDVIRDLQRKARDRAREAIKKGKSRARPSSQQNMADTDAFSVMSDGPTYDGRQWTIPGAGKFNHKAEYTFYEGTLPAGLKASNYLVEDQRNGLEWNHQFSQHNVHVDGDFLNLVVPGVKDTNPKLHPSQAISCAEVITEESNILYGSVRTKAVFSPVPGACHGIFFYKNDQQETDIEFLTDPSSQANDGSIDGAIPIWYSNQATKIGKPGTQATGPPPSDVTAVHEYRIDWTKSFTAFYVDGVLQKRFDTNIPSKPGSWIWNNWANGDKSWSCGPPKQDNVFKILSIEMYYNTSDKTVG